ncbi:ACP S-malonyltransferase [Cupriavidus gilardii]|uniref:ACP S-malonyltransferase n=1 Tax=Cupriavidus gilardii TaxID=82541 RepID=UPI0009EE2F3C|nr:acyltransferase domain-containing protein [Cupriavidus gilardii]
MNGRSGNLCPPIYVIPGQGDNPVGALLPLYQSGQLARASIDETLDVIETALSEHHDGFDPKLVRKVLLGVAPIDAIPVGVPQMSAFATAVCVHRVLERQGWCPFAIIGQSLGEIASLVCSGVWSIPDGAHAVLAMNSAFRPFEGRGGMVAMIASEADTLMLLDTLSDSELVLACVNAPRRTIVSGPDAALAELAALARRHSIGSQKLPVPYPAHHPALQAAADEFHDAIAKLPRRDFQVPVYSAVSRRRYTNSDNLPRLLADCFTKPYHMPAALEHAGIGHDAIYVDLGMTGIMSRCIRAILPSANVLVPTRANPLSPFERDISNV